MKGYRGTKIQQQRSLFGGPFLSSQKCAQRHGTGHETRDNRNELHVLVFLLSAVVKCPRLTQSAGAIVAVSRHSSDISPKWNRGYACAESNCKQSICSRLADTTFRPWKHSFIWSFVSPDNTAAAVATSTSASRSQKADTPQAPR